MFENLRTMELLSTIRYHTFMRRYFHPDAASLDLPRVLHALADPVRLEMVRRIAAMGELPCGALGDERPKSSMSHHFRTLREAGVIRTQVCGALHLNTLRRDDLEARFPGLLAVVLADQR
jgi:DNA-binding transcriptional ArsR family regulator